MLLENTNAIVTGGSSGIGRAISCRLADEGANVAVGDVREEPKGDEVVPTAQLVRERGRDALFYELDVTDHAACRAFTEAAADSFGGIDVLVNNAGNTPRGVNGKQVHELSEDEWKLTVDLNLKGAFNCSKFAMPYIRESDRGRVVNISSKKALQGHAESSPAYSAAKGGVNLLTKQLAVDYGRYDVTANAIAPGIIQTGTKAYRMETKGDVMRENTRLPFLGSADDIAAAIVYLCSADGDYVTGHTLVVDGGWTA